MPVRAIRYRRLLPLLAVFFFLLSQSAFAHDIPIDVTVQMFVKPAGKQLHVLMRVPLRAMRDVEFPERGAGFLDLAKVDPSLRDAATLWLSNSTPDLRRKRAASRAANSRGPCIT